MHPARTLHKAKHVHDIGCVCLISQTPQLTSAPSNPPITAPQINPETGVTTTLYNRASE